MAIKVIVELQAKPGRGAQLHRLLAGIVVAHGPGQPGFLGSTSYEVVDQPDMLVEIAEWESAEARLAHLRDSTTAAAYAPLLELVAAPIRATVIRPLP